jgi:uridylate kinase
MEKTILIKLSGESLAGSNADKRGLDDEYVTSICKKIKKIHDSGAHIGIVSGGGNFMRGGRTSKIINREVADYMGMLGTVMNALALYDGFSRLSCPVYLQSGLKVAVPVANDINPDDAIKALDEGKIVVFGGGTGHPGCTTDTASALRAKDINADTDFELHLEADTSKSTYDIKNNTIKIYPSAEGEVTYAVQLKQPHIPLYHGAEYTLTYDAYAANDRTMIVDIEGPDRNWKRYFNDTTVELTRNKKTYKHKFTMNDKFDANGCLEFNLGAQGSTAPVTISNVKLKITGGEIIDDSKIKEVRPDGNYVYNGKFEEGTGRLKYWEISDEDKDAVSVTNVNNVRELKVVAPEGTSEENPFVIKQSGLPLVEGKYRLSFDAYKENADTENPEIEELKNTIEIVKNTMNGRQIEADYDSENSGFWSRFFRRK